MIRRVDVPGGRFAILAGGAAALGLDLPSLAECLLNEYARGRGWAIVSWNCRDVRLTNVKGDNLSRCEFSLVFVAADR